MYDSDEGGSPAGDVFALSWRHLIDTRHACINRRSEPMEPAGGLIRRPSSGNRRGGQRYG